MKLNDSQRNQINKLIEAGKQKQYNSFNKVIEQAVNEWKQGDKSNKDAYNKIYKKVVKNEHLLTQRYADLDDQKSLNTLTELFSDDIINMFDFENLDESIKNEVLKISGIKN